MINQTMTTRQLHKQPPRQQRFLKEADLFSCYFSSSFVFTKKNEKLKKTHLCRKQFIREGSICLRYDYLFVLGETH